MMQPLQSAADGDMAQARARFNAAGLAVQLGVDPAAAKQTEIVGTDRGLAPGVATDILVKAASLSALGEKDFASAAAATAAFSSFEVGMATATALSRGGITGEGLRESVMATGRVLGLAGDTLPFAEKFGLAGKSELEKLVTLAQHAITTGDQALSPDERINRFSQTLGADLPQLDARAVGIMMRQIMTFHDTLQQISDGGAAGTLSAKVQTLMEDPVTAHALRREQTRAVTGLQPIYGPHAERGRLHSDRLMAIGADEMERGITTGVDEHGQAGYFARLVAAIRDTIDPQGRLQVPAYDQATGRVHGTTRGPSALVDADGLKRSLDNVAEALITMPEKLERGMISRNGGNE